MNFASVSTGTCSDLKQLEIKAKKDSIGKCSNLSFQFQIMVKTIATTEPGGKNFNVSL